MLAGDYEMEVGVKGGNNPGSGAGPPVLVLAPHARDTALTCEFLKNAGIDAKPCATLDELCAALSDLPGAVLVAEEALAGGSLSRLSSALSPQPPWSDLPVLVLTSARAGPQPDRQALHLMEVLGNATLITRPVHRTTLLSIVRAALRARRRQYELREHYLPEPQARARLPGANEEGYRRLVDTIPLATFILQDGRAVYANPAALSLVGAPDLTAVVNQPVRRWIHPDSLAAMAACIAQLAAVAEPLPPMEQKWVRLDGLPIDVEVSAARLPWGGKTAIQVGVQDITRRKAVEDALRLGESRFRAALQDAPVTVFQQDRELRYAWIYNPFYGRPPEEFIGRRDIELFPRREETEAVEAFKREVMESRIGGRRKFRLSMNAAAPREFDVIAEPVANESGDVMGVIGAALDVSEYVGVQDQLRRQADQLARMDQRKNEFIAQLAHELRNPLAPIHNAVHVLKIQPDPPDPVHLKWAIEVIGRQVQHLGRLVDDLLDIARITHGEIKLRMERLELGRVLTQVIEAARPLTMARKQVVTYSPPIEPVHVRADPTRLVQIVGNLLGNAARYTPSGGHIALTARREGDEAVITVTDDGIGIAPEALPHVFEPFYQGERPPDYAQVGLGLGLALVHRLVTLHEGAVEARSGGSGKGSEFIVRLPVLDQEPAPMAEIPVAQPEPGTGWRILVVDDDPDVAQSFSLLLRLMGHQVRAVNTGAAALETAPSFQPQVAFIDIGLPDMDGYDLARSLRAQSRRPGLRLIALTGYAQEQVRQRAAAAGFDAHLLKPVTADTVEQLLASFRSS